MEEKFELKSSLGIKFACRIWKEEKTEYKGIVQIVHGMQEHIGRYSKFAEILAKRGYIVIGHDLLGHGNTVKSEDEYGHFADENGFEYLIKDIHIVQNYAKEKYPDLKYILFGHSLGSILVREYITKYQDKIDKIILSGTCSFRPIIPFSHLLVKILKIFCGKKYKSLFLRDLVLWEFNKSIPNSTLLIDWVSRDEEVLKSFSEDDKCLKPFSLQAYDDLLTGIWYISNMKNIKKSLKVPMLFISGDLDPVGEMSKGVIRAYKKYEKINDDVTIRLIKNARHEVLNEINKEFTYEIIFSWIEK